MTVSLPVVRELIEQAVQEPAIVDAADGSADAVIRAGDHLFLIEIKSDSRSASVAAAIKQLEACADSYADRRGADIVPTLVVTHMGAAGADLCRQHGINWIDLDGNADIKAPELRIRIQGQRSKLWPKQKHGANPFATKASRVSHVLLLDPRKPWTRAQLLVATGLDKGSVSRTVGALSAGGYLKSDSTAAATIVVADPRTLLDAWAEHYRPRPPVAYGLLSTADGVQTERRVYEILNARNIGAIFGGLPAAAAYTSFGSFRRVRVYVNASLSRDVRAELNVSEDSRGRNVLLVADDGGASIGSETHSGQVYTSPILAYLDLQDEAERAEEARAELLRVIEARWT